MARREDGPDPVRPIEAVSAPAEDPTWDRLEDQISGAAGEQVGHEVFEVGPGGVLWANLTPTSECLGLTDALQVVANGPL